MNKEQLQALAERLRKGDDSTESEAMNVANFSDLVRICVDDLNISCVDLAVRFSASLHTVTRWKTGHAPHSAMRTPVFQYLLSLVEEKVSAFDSVVLAAPVLTMGHRSRVARRYVYAKCLDCGGKGLIWTYRNRFWWACACGRRQMVYIDTPRRSAKISP